MANQNCQPLTTVYYCNIVMSQHKFKLKPSKTLMSIMIFLFVGGEACLIATGFSWWLTIIFAIFYGAGFYYIWRHYVFMYGTKMIVKFWRGNDNNWYLVNSKQITYLAQLLPSSVVTPLVLILHFSVEEGQIINVDGGKHDFVSVVIFKDMLSANDFRRFLVDVITSRLNID